MQKPSIIGVATAAGIAAFCWTLYKRGSEIPLRRPHSYTYPQPPSSNTMAAAGPISTAGTTIEELERHVQVSPADYRAWSRLGERLSWAGRDDDAKQAYAKVLELTQAISADDPEFSRSRFTRGMTLRALGDEPGSIATMAAYRKWVSSLGYDVDSMSSRQSLHRIAWAARITSDEETARRAWLRAVELTKPEQDVTPGHGYDLACYLAQLGRTQESLKALKQVAAAGYADPLQAANDEDLIALHEAPEFAEILRQIRRNARRMRTPEQY